MRGTVAKALRRMAREERKGEQGVVNVAWSKNSSGSTQLAAHSVRALSQKLKSKYKRVRAGLSPMTAAEERSAGIAPAPVKARPKRRRIPRPLIQRRAGVIEKPLMLILEYCQPEVVRDMHGQPMTVIPHPLWKQARIAADRGDGATVRRIAAQFV